MSHISYIHCRGEAEEKVKICGPLGLELSDNSLSNAARGAINVSKRAPLLYEKSWHEINTLSTLPFSKLQTFGMQKCNTLIYAHCMLHIAAWYPMISDGLRVCFCLVPRGRHGWSSRWQGRHQSSLKNAARKRIRVNMVILWSRHGLLESIEKKRIPWSHTKLPQPSPVMTILGPSWSCFCVSCWHIFGVQLQACFFWAIGLSGLPFSPIPSAAFGLQQSLAAVTNQFQDAQRCLDLLDSCLVLFTIYIVHCCSLFQSWFWKLRMYRIFDCSLFQSWFWKLRMYRIFDRLQKPFRSAVLKSSSSISVQLCTIAQTSNQMQNEQTVQTCANQACSVLPLRDRSSWQVRNSDPISRVRDVKGSDIEKIWKVLSSDSASAVRVRVWANSG